MTKLVIARLPWLPALGAVTLAPAGVKADPGESALDKISVLLRQPNSCTSMVAGSLHGVQTQARQYASVLSLHANSELQIFNESLWLH